MYIGFLESMEMLGIKAEGLEMQANFCLAAGIYKHGYIYMYIYVYICVYINVGVCINLYVNEIM
jgi:hypothetical protein